MTPRAGEPAIAARYIVLVYEEDDSRKNQQSFERSYGSLCASTTPDRCEIRAHLTMPLLKINNERRLKCVLVAVE